MSFDVPYTFGATVLEFAKLNANFNAIEGYLANLQAQINALAAGSAPDLSNYATLANLSAHVAAEPGHPGQFRLHGAPTGRILDVQLFDHTIPGSGSSFVVFPLSYAPNGACLGVFVQNIEDATNTWVTGMSATGATIHGTAGTNIKVLVIGYR